MPGTARSARTIRIWRTVSCGCCVRSGIAPQATSRPPGIANKERRLLPGVWPGCRDHRLVRVVERRAADREPGAPRLLRLAGVLWLPGRREHEHGTEEHRFEKRRRDVGKICAPVGNPCSGAVPSVGDVARCSVALAPGNTWWTCRLPSGQSPFVAAWQARGWVAAPPGGDRWPVLVPGRSLPPVTGLSSRLTRSTTL
jgi:hypothetical protein